MLDYRRKLLYGVTRIRSTFEDGLNPPKVGEGTGFWVKLKSGKICFITNRHILDPTLQFSPDCQARLKSVKLELRKVSGEEPNPILHPETRFFEIDGPAVFLNGDADCALVLPLFSEPTDDYRIYAPLEESDLATTEFFDESLMPAHDLYFIGFPGRPADELLQRKASAWWDTRWNLPIVRSAVLGSTPFPPFTNDAIKIDDVLLVSGMSFEGSSGSPVISREIGFRTNPSGPGKGLRIRCEGYVPEKVIGIVSGHWWSEKDYPEVFKHSGLSYLTRCTSILHLIKQNNL